MPASPALKYPGGKTQLLPIIREALPKRIRRYYEPCVGGGAVAIDMLETMMAHQAVGLDPSNAGLPYQGVVIGDINPDIADVYTGIKEAPEDVIQALSVHDEKHSETYYYERRAEGPLFHRTWSAAERAARVIYLNKAGFNGLQRKNGFGKITVSFGKRAKVRSCDPGNIRALSAALHSALIRQGDWEAIVCDVQPGDFVYIDPPYLYPPDSPGFTDYSGTPFTEHDHKRIVAFALRMARDYGVNVLVSNDDNELVRQVYRPLNLISIQAPRSISRDSDGRKAVPEILAANYPLKLSSGTPVER